MSNKIQSFRILDLFSGAGGFSYGMEKNEHFKTVIAVDFNPNALATFKHNMPDAHIITGDITDARNQKANYRSKSKVKSKYDYRWTALSRIFIER